MQLAPAGEMGPRLLWAIRNPCACSATRACCPPVHPPPTGTAASGCTGCQVPSSLPLRSRNRPCSFPLPAPHPVRPRPCDACNPLAPPTHPSNTHLARLAPQTWRACWRCAACGRWSWATCSPRSSCRARPRAPAPLALVLVFLRCRRLQQLHLAARRAAELCNLHLAASFVDREQGNA